MSLKTQNNVYTWIWVIYLLQGVLYPAGRIGQALFLVIMGYSMYMMLKVLSLKQKQPRFISFLTLLVGMYFLYGVIRIIKGPGQGMFDEYTTLTYIKTYMLSLCPIYVYYYFAIKGVLDEQWFRKYVFIFMTMTIVSFFYNQFQAQVLFGAEEITNNVAYNFVAMLPICLFWYKKPLVQYILIGVAALFVLISMKRGAILVFVISAIPFLLRTFKYSSKKNKAKVLFGIILLFFLTYYAVQKMLDSNDYFRYRIEQTMEGKTSNRDVIYESLWDEFSNNYSLPEMLVGRGADATIEVYGKLAHNDWLETLLDQGILGVIVFFLFWLSMYITQNNMKKKDIAATALLIIFISGFIRTFFSMSIGQMPICYTSVLGYCIYIYSQQTAAVKHKIE